MFCISKINRVITWMEETQSKRGLGCKAVFWPQIGSTCTHVLKGEAKGLMRQFEASSSAFLGPVSLRLRNEVVSSVCLQSSGICGPAIMRDERERESAGLLSLGLDALICSAQTTARTRLIQNRKLQGSPCPPARNLT